MFNFDNATIISSDYILSKISEADIFKRYCKNFEVINKPFCSEFRVDNNPSCNIYRSDKGLRYKDFGDGSYYDCFNYIIAKYGCKYFEALNIVSNDFNLANTSDLNNYLPIISDNIPLNRESVYIRLKTQIQVISQPFTISDYNYWSKYHINLELLKEYNVFSAKYVIISKPKGRIIIEYANSNPTYAYKFTGETGVSYKIYRPYEAKYKWTFNGTKDDIEGYDQLNLHGKLLIITKSLKDVMCLRALGYNSISLQGEANKLSNDIYKKLLKRFDKIVIFYDQDVVGNYNSDRISKDYDIDKIVIPQEYLTKDISDFIKEFGIKKAKELIKSLLK